MPQTINQAMPPRSGPINALSIGIGLRAPHYQAVIDTLPAVGWLEVHSENFFTANGRRVLDAVADHYPLSFHGIGLSLGSSDPLNPRHLAQLKALVDRYQPALLSEHLSWSSYHGRYFNDLLPLPYTRESLDHFSSRVAEVQERLGRQLLIENPTAYLRYQESYLAEADFLAELHQRTGCGILLDLNNLYINSINLGMAVDRYLDTLPTAAVQELHLAGFTRKQLDNGEILIDTHGSRVAEPVWQLFSDYRQRCPAPALIEWDTDIPALAVLLDEAHRAHQVQQRDSEAWRASA